MSLTTPSSIQTVPSTIVEQSRRQYAAAVLASASGTVSIALANGATLTGTIDVTGLAGGFVKVTAGGVVWIVPLHEIVAAGS